MNIGIDARLLDNVTGIGRYTRSLFFEYAQQKAIRSDRLFLFVDKPFQASSQTPVSPSQPSMRWPENAQMVTASCKQRILWTNWFVPPLLHQHKIDVYHGVCNFELPLRKVCRYVVTIHDLVPLFFPEVVPRKLLLFFKLFMKRVAHTADVIITISEHSKHDIIQHLQVPEEKVRVVYLGAEVPRSIEYEPDKIREIRKKYGIGRPYLLFVGVIEPKKNLERLVEAFALLNHEGAIGREFQLVIAGGRGWLSDQLYRKVHELRLERQVIFTGFVPDEELPFLYQGAELFVFPSLYEGFGLPLLEAMAYGTPVVTSNVSSLPEVAGNAGELVNPYEPEDICQGMTRVLIDSSKREAMKQAGRIQAQRFPWKNTAEETYKVYLEAYQMSK